MVPLPRPKFRKVSDLLTDTLLHGSFAQAEVPCRISSQILCSMVTLPRPKFRKVDKAKRRCLFQVSPLLMNSPPRHKHAEEVGLKAQGN
ncbi:hypothetical protein EYF80_055771 [Liparis tanakae]|uniref:Uncharacterized protein n=1 Tax=Liparis tanakae TaxID=230148 RepID=A0A4Z2F090_9TELE|nr:hypothetical protein EYF80_055771 [Liparis tanakae]